MDATAVSSVLAGWDAGRSGTAVSGDRLVHVEFVWGTAVTVELAGVSGREAHAVRAAADCVAWFAEVDHRFSTFRALSEVTAFRNGLTHPGGPSPDMVEVLVACRNLRTLTRGSFDPWRVAGGFDPSGFVKGWAAGRASRLLSDAGFADHMVNAGGDVVCSGSRTGDRSGWPIGLVDPRDRHRVLRVVDVRDATVATSGRYERGDHVLDPRTASAASGAESATVVGPEPGPADAAASAALVDGPDSLAWFGDLGPGWSLHLVVDGREFGWGPAFEATAAPYG